MPIRLSPQKLTVVVFRGRDYIDAKDLAAAMTRWAEEYDAAGEPERAATIRYLRDTLEEPAATEVLAAEVEVRT